MKKFFCKCGKLIWLEYKFNGFIVIPVYFNIQGEKAVKITNCTGCSEKIIYYDLKKE